MHYSLTTDDHELVAACLSGLDEAWEVLVLKYEKLIYSICRKYNLSQEDAEDVFSKVCLLLVQNLEKLRNYSRLYSWLITTTTRECWRYKPGKHLVYIGTSSSDSENRDKLEKVAEPQPLVEEKLVELEEQQRLREAINQLSPKHQKLLWHLFYDPAEPSYQEIAKLLNIPVASIGPTRLRCLEKLRALLPES